MNGMDNYPIRKIARMLDVSRVAVYGLVSRGRMELATGTEPAAVTAAEFAAFLQVEIAALKEKLRRYEAVLSQVEKGE